MVATNGTHSLHTLDSVFNRNQPTAFSFANGQLATVKVGFAARLVPEQTYAYAAPLVGKPPCVGDLVLVRVKQVGRHTRIEDCAGRRMLIVENDCLVGVYGNRYATDQYEGIVPEDTRRCEILSAAAVCGVVLSKHSAMPQPTELEVIGMVYDSNGRQVNLRRFGLPVIHKSVSAATNISSRPTLIAVVGASMNSGKTTTVASLVQGLTRQGYRVAAGKITGTASGNDRWNFHDHGAVAVLDFSDCGYPSTYCCTEDELLQIYRTIYHGLCQAEPDFIVVEIADGLVQQETAALLSHPEMYASLDHMLYAAGDSLAAAAGQRWLDERGYQTLGLSGLISASPLATREAEALTGLRCYTREELLAGDVLLPHLRQRLQEHSYAV